MNTETLSTVLQVVSGLMTGNAIWMLIVWLIYRKNPVKLVDCIHTSWILNKGYVTVFLVTLMVWAFMHFSGVGQ